MSLMTLQIGPKANEAPNQSGGNNLTLDSASSHVFTVANFTTETSPPYNDPEGDAFRSVKFNSLPVTGSLLLSGNSLSLGAEVTAAQLNNGDFIYQADIAEPNAYTESLEFVVSDEGSGLFNSIPSDYTINVLEAINEAPSVVGDGTMNLEYGETGIFTRDMFTTNTTPPYSDPEGDGAFILRIDALPVLGKIKLNGVNVIAGQTIGFDQIDDELLTYVPDLADTDGDMQGFQFSVADSGSMEFTS